MNDTLDNDPDDDFPRAKKPGRKRNLDFLSYEEACLAVREELIPSRSKYLAWWEREKPKTLPRYPYRVYIKEWKSWNAFLGTDNKFKGKGSGTAGSSWRQIDEAILWVHKLALNSQAEWMEWCKTHERPKDIPARPDLVYHKWRSWNHWLGNKAREALEARQAAARRKVFYIAHYPESPMNVYVFRTEEGGLSALKERCDGERFEIIKMFWFDPTKAVQLQNIINWLSSTYIYDDRQRVAPNIHQITWELQLLLETIHNVNV